MASKSKVAASPSGPRLVDQSYELVPIDSIRPHPKNVNEGNLPAIVESMRVHGFFGALRVQQSSGYIVAGNHSWRAAKELQYEKVPVIMLDVDDDQAVRLMLVDNQTARESHNREQDLANLLIDIQKTPSALVGTGFTGDALDDLLASLEKNAPYPGGDDGSESGGEDGDSEDGAAPVSGSNNSPVIQYAIVFTDETEQRAWFEFLKKLKACYPEGTISGRIVAYVEKYPPTA